MTGLAYLFGEHLKVALRHQVRTQARPPGGDGLLAMPNKADGFVVDGAGVVGFQFFSGAQHRVQV